MVPSIKLFVILGTQKFPFNRLMKALDELIVAIENCPCNLFCVKCPQIFKRATASAYYDYIPQKAKYCKLLPPDEFIYLIKTASVVITHAGVNSILTCMQQNKHFLVVPRLKQYGEHVDNHQKEIAQVMEEQFNVLVLKDTSNLADYIQMASTHTYIPWKPNNQALLASLIEFLDN